MSSRLKRGLLLAAACQMATISNRYGAMNKRGVFGVPEYMTKSGNTLEDGKPRKQQPKRLHEFKIKGNTVMAYSRKDAISKLKAKGLI